MNPLITTYLLIFCFTYVYVRLLIVYIKVFTRFMFNEPTKWDKYIEKPRLAFHILGLALMHISYPEILKYFNSPYHIFHFLNWFIFLGGMSICHSTWSKRFKNIFIPSIKKKLKSKRNFGISISRQQLSALYNELVRFDMIDIESTTYDDFEKVLLLDWKAHTSKIHFNLDAPSCREFYEFFKTKFPNNSLSLTDFFDRSGGIRRDDGKTYTYTTIKNAKSRTPVSKRNDDLKVIFSNL